MSITGRVVGLELSGGVDEDELVSTGRGGVVLPLVSTGTPPLIGAGLGEGVATTPVPAIISCS